MFSSYKYLIILLFSLIIKSSNSDPSNDQISVEKKPRIFILNRDLPVDETDILVKRCDVIFGRKSENASALAKKIAQAGGVDAIVWFGHWSIDEEILQAAGPQCKLVAAVSVGFDNYDLNLLKKYGIKLTNTAQVPSNAVADIAIYLILATSRRTEESRRKVVEGQCEPGFQWQWGQDLAESTVGIVGLGAIGAAVAKRLPVFGVEKILYFDIIQPKYATDLNAKFVPFEILMQQSDIIVAALTLTNASRGMFNATSFAWMKKSAIFVNIARGSLVNTADLVDALKSKKIFAAGLDVVDPEPLPMDHELLKLPNCVITPHIGSATIKARRAMTKLAIDNVLAYLDGKPLLTPVN